MSKYPPINSTRHEMPGQDLTFKPTPEKDPGYDKAMAERDARIAALTDKVRSAMQREQTSNSAPDVHELKVWPEYFRDLLSGQKTFEVRKNDRGFGPRHLLVLREWDPVNEKYTGRSVSRFVRYVLHGGRFGIKDGYVVLGLDKA